mmetsp:Transcript_11840/g.33454  ORF Transcript_11840/g.33454 Transcript_11840/m.33454 type:complete len:203 (+) Transcript_11840:494-1102(+)
MQQSLGPQQPRRRLMRQWLPLAPHMPQFALPDDGRQIASSQHHLKHGERPPLLVQLAASEPQIAQNLREPHVQKSHARLHVPQLAQSYQSSFLGPHQLARHGQAGTRAPPTRKPLWPLLHRGMRQGQPVLGRLLAPALNRHFRGQLLQSICHVRMGAEKLQSPEPGGQNGPPRRWPLRPTQSRLQRVPRYRPRPWLQPHCRG